MKEPHKGTYRHTKSGKEYTLLGTAFHTETEELLVIYKPLYTCEFELFARPYDMFFELVETSGEMKPRFERVDTAILESTS